MTPMDQTLSRGSDGHDATEGPNHGDSRRAGCASGQASGRAVGHAPKAATLQQQIEVLFKTGLSDAEIAERLGCKPPYVRVARQRAGLFRAATSRPRGQLTEARLIARVESLQDKLASAWAELRRWRDGQSRQP